MSRHHGTISSGERGWVHRTPSRRGESFGAGVTVSLMGQFVVFGEEVLLRGAVLRVAFESADSCTDSFSGRRW